ncbi:hypothetical protein AB12_3440 [Escherichia coli 1-182-04_S1_C1]|nr:hypothetical protein AB12_3440 [Escherichia coli 1-182-04_S1_C1]
MVVTLTAKIQLQQTVNTVELFVNDPDPKSCAIQKQSSCMIYTP